MSSEPAPLTEGSVEGNARRPDKHSLTVVGIGGSAGGLPALIKLLERLEGPSSLAFVVVLHLAPDQESHAAEILQRVTSLVVVQVKDRTRLEPGHVYVIAPGTNLITDDGHVQPSAKKVTRPSFVIDLFFRTLGEVHQEHAVGIVLSGTGRDGSLGIAQIKERGGFTFAQAPTDSEHKDMPEAAIATGTVDLVLPAAEIGSRLANLVQPLGYEAMPAAEEMTPPKSMPMGEVDDQSTERAIHEVLTALRLRTRHDFRNYKRATLMRRIERRMRVNGMSTIQAYRDFVRANPDELSPLLADLLISVTHFFRDPAAFEALETQVVPAVMEAVSEENELRVWVAACASGEEGYSLAILLQEYADRMIRPPRMLIFASDINESALSVARAAVYPSSIAADVSEGRLRGFFDKEEGELYRVRSVIREKMIFARHNVLSDPPFSRLDLICCRNLLIYLDRTAQTAVLEMFAYALKPGGYLFLGNAESIDAMSTGFEAVDKEQRIYRLKTDFMATARVRMPPRLEQPEVADPAIPVAQVRDPFALQEAPVAALHERALVVASPPSVLINGEYELERVSAGASRFVAFGEGVPSRNLLNNVAPDIRVELRTALLRASESRHPVKTIFLRNGVEGPDTGPVMTLSIHPVMNEETSTMHWLVIFDERANLDAPAPEAEGSGPAPIYSAIGRLEEENRSLKVHLQRTLDRSAVSTEELKASNEELQAINEELRSAKEELETSREELQSLNEELTTVNFELRMKVEEAGRNNDDLQNLIDASEIATVFVDSAMRIKRFTPQATKLFALIPTDVGRPLLDVTSRLNYKAIVEDASSVFRQLRAIERSVTTTNGEHYLARILPYRTSADKIGGAVLSFVDVSALREAEDRVRQTETRLRDAIAASKDFAVLSTDPRGKIMSWNEGAKRMFGYDAVEIVGQPVDVLFTAEDRKAGVSANERRVAEHEGRASEERYLVRMDGSTFYCSSVLTPMQVGDEVGFLKIARDTSEAKGRELQSRIELGEAKREGAEQRHVSEAKDRFLAVMSHELKQPLNLIHVSAELLVRLPELRESSSVQRLGNTILRAVSAQETIVNDLLDLSRIQTGKLRLQIEPTDIVDLVRHLVEAIAHDAEKKGIVLTVDAPDRKLRCDCDRVRMEQIVWNLLGNAIKFTPRGGEIHVKVSAEAGAIKLEIEDTGAGISAEALPTIFELFSQAPNPSASAGERGGLGIGLALVRELVHAHHGRIEAASPGIQKGSTFTVWLPTTGRSSLSVNGKGLAVSLERRMLMVDDDSDSADLFALVLRMEGASVDTAASGAEALQKLANGEYDVLLSDIGMPGMSGLEMIQKARQLALPKRPYAIAISGYGREADIQAALNAGFDDHLSKPISLDRLLSALKKA